MHLDDTIVAIATPPGRGGIGVVRIAGDQARAIAAPMLRFKAGHGLEAGRAHFCELIEPATGERLDEVVATFFAKPHSYTTDDIVEISAHGAPVLLRHIVELVTAAGARLAEPGEFTQRAFLHGRIDLTQAEAVRDLIESQTLFQAKTAAQQLEGALSNRLKPIKQRLLELIAQLEAGVDFAEDDVGVMSSDEVLKRIAEIRPQLQRLAESFAFGKVVHDGLTLAIVGRPNVGKSSLFNRLVERERAIVTATPGTTRDLISETVAIGGIPVRLVDTAGIREAKDEAESIGIRKSYEALADADVVLIVVEASSGLHDEDQRLLDAVEQRRSVLVANKTDLGTAAVPKGAVRTSATTGDGIERLRSEVLRHVGGEGAGQAEPGFLTNVRHQGLVAAAIRGLDSAKTAVDQRIPHEMLLLDLYSALKALDEITGATASEDVLGLIFSAFCIGK